MAIPNGTSGVESGWTRRELYYGLLMVFFFVNPVLPTLIYLKNGNLPTWLLGEDGVYESVAAVCCLGAGAIFLYAFIRFPGQADLFLLSSKRNPAVLALALLFLFLFLEEISWGQRVFNIDTPGFFAERNVQNEINLHNFKIIQSERGTISDLLFKLLNIYLILLPLFSFSFVFIRRIVQRLAFLLPVCRSPLSVSFSIG